MLRNSLWFHRTRAICSVEGRSFSRLAISVLVVVPLLVLVLTRVSQPAGDQAGSSAPALPSTTGTSQPTTTRSTQTPPDVTRVVNSRLQWSRPRFTERQRERDTMVDTQIARTDPFSMPVRDRRVLDALRVVPRHEFVPAERQRSAYADTPLPIGYGQTISQPYIVALMTELLEIKEGDKILEIGTGSGYQAAVLSELTPYVCTIEIVEPLCKQASERFTKLGYKTMRARAGDGYDGWNEYAPFDGIIVTCAAGHVPPPLWDQLKVGGRLVIPIGGTYETQRLLVLTKRPDGGRASRNVLPVAFVPMTGKIQEP